LTPFTIKNSWWAIGRVIDTDTILPLDFPRAKVDAGIFVDVVPVDGVPNDEKKRKSHLKKLLLWTWFGNCVNTYTASSSRKIFLAIPFFFAIYLFRIFCPSFCSRIVNKISRKYSMKDSDYVLPLLFVYGDKIFPSSAFAEYIDVPFEGRTFKAIKGYDTFLTHIYGDYMTPPKRMQHDFTAYYKNK
jgi:lipopolysaccharide cholinephosphotransferase